MLEIISYLPDKRYSRSFVWLFEKTINICKKKLFQKVLSNGFLLKNDDKWAHLLCIIASRLLNEQQNPPDDFVTKNSSSHGMM